MNPKLKKGLVLWAIGCIGFLILYGLLGITGGIFGIGLWAVLYHNR
jgi:hypothetical protein